MAKTKYIHRGVVKDDKFVFDNPRMYANKISQLNGKRFEMILEKEYEKPNQSQRGYYFGGIIGAECMNSECFGGWTKEEIHIFFLKHLTAYEKELVYPDGTVKTELCHESREDFRGYSKDEMATYITMVISFLNLELNIYPKDPDAYKFEKQQRIENINQKYGTR